MSPKKEYLIKKIAVVFLVFTLFLYFGGTADATNYAGLVVRHSDGSVVRRCVAFDEPSISGIELLFRSGLSVDTSSSGYGTSVYGIDGEGTVDDWNSGRAFWSYWHLRGSWVYSPVGASSYSVKPGDVEGWSWGSQTSPIAPPVTSFDELYRDAYGDPPTPTSQPPAADPTTPAAPAPPAAQPGSSSSAQDKNISGVGKDPGAAAAQVNVNPGSTNKNAATSTIKTGSATTAKSPISFTGAKSYALFGLILIGLVSALAYVSQRKKG